MYASKKTRRCRMAAASWCADESLLCMLAAASNTAADGGSRISSAGDHDAWHSMERLGGKSSAHLRIMRVRAAHDAGHISQEDDGGLAECARSAACKGERRRQKSWPSKWAIAAKAPQARAAASSSHEAASSHAEAAGLSRSPQPACGSLPFPRIKICRRRARMLAAAPCCPPASVKEEGTGGCVSACGRV